MARTVGTRGLFGCRTSEMPVAKKASPSPGSVAAKSGRSAPWTAEVLTPAFSNWAPSASTRVPTVHAIFRCLSRGQALLFGGGSDLTPYYPERDDGEHFHRSWKSVCDRHDPSYYARFKKWGDDYFYLPHRGETRGIGGIFFDQLARDPARDFAFVRDAGEAFLEAYLPIVKRRRGDAWGERERQFQLLRRGRYGEFNLLYDRGTTFGLKTDGRTESILMSLPPLVRWEYDARFETGSREADLPNWLKPRDWLGGG